MALTTAELVERFTKAPQSHKVAGLVLVMAFFGALFYFMFYSDIADQSDQLGMQITNLEQQKADYQEKERQYNSFRVKVHQLLEEQKELVKVLPTTAEIPNFLQSIAAQGELAGLNILTFEQQPEVKQNFYAMIPVKMTISGSYHQITKFFYSVGKLKRIVNIKDLKLGSPKSEEPGVQLTADFITSTYRFLAPAANQGQPGQPGTPG